MATGYRSSANDMPGNDSTDDLTFPISVQKIKPPHLPCFPLFSARYTKSLYWIHCITVQSQALHQFWIHRITVLFLALHQFWIHCITVLFLALPSFPIHCITVLFLFQPETHFFLGNMLAAKGNLTGSIWHYNEALNQNPGHQQAFTMLRNLRYFGSVFETISVDLLLEILHH